MATFCDAKKDVVAAGHGFNSYFPASQRVRQRAEQQLQRSEELRTDQLGGWSVGDRSSWERLVVFVRLAVVARLALVVNLR